MEKYLWSRWAQCEHCPFECGQDEPETYDDEEELIIYHHTFECGAGEICDTDVECNKCN